jgi:GH15 family glucan-1,4-alpha-glucosidase
MILETTFTTAEGVVSVTDFMPIEDEVIHLIRVVRGISGHVELHTRFSPRFDYGLLFPYIEYEENHPKFVCGPSQVILRTEEELTINDYSASATFTVGPGDERSFQASWSKSHKSIGKKLDPMTSLQETSRYWTDWMKSSHLGSQSPHEKILRRSIITLKAMTYMPTGSLVAAITTSIPEEPGGEKNWDYRLCWPRDASLAIGAVIDSTGQSKEVDAWRHWLHRASAGLPSQLNTVFGLHGERLVTERSIEWLSGFETSRPVRVGNAANRQLQLDIYVEVVEAFYSSRKLGLKPIKGDWESVNRILCHLEEIWSEPDEGLWEVRGIRRHFVQSKVMVWDAFRRGIEVCREFKLDGPLDRWTKVMKAIHKDVCEKGFNQKRNSFTQFYGAEDLDASLLAIPLTGFLSVEDPRVISTIEAIERELVFEEGLIMRYRPKPEVEGLPGSRPKAFLLCSAWLGTVYAMRGEKEKTRAILEKLISISNDVGLLSEQYDPLNMRQLGNFPQAYSHISIISLALALALENKS